MSWIVNHHQFSEQAHDPSTVVLARLAEQPDLLLPGWFSSIGDDPAEPRVGLEVEAQTSRDGEETRIIWRTPDGVGAE